MPYHILSQMLTGTAPNVQDTPVVDDTAVDDTRWKVIAHDDPVTTMDFVVWVLVQFFYKPLIFAEAIMWQVHTEGQSVVDVLPKAEAERRVAGATFAARLQGFPFRFTIEPEP
ncbi:MAG TPA: ATP-dependent Clp protease adaptor ClpS [Chloroflexota bacterium]|nr:ATP-dependent Clp protease adaptor ClpS [Chloroflexota bacterium]